MTRVERAELTGLVTELVERHEAMGKQLSRAFKTLVDALQDGEATRPVINTAEMLAGLMRDNLDCGGMVVALAAILERDDPRRD